MSDQPAITISSLNHHYGERQALRDLNMEVASGEFAAILGPNGAGKSTLFRVLSTLTPPQSGKVLIGGTDPAADVTAVRRRLGVVFQSPGLDPRLTVRENLLHAGWLYGLSGRQLGDRADSLMERFGVADRARDPVSALSGGLQRRVELARALLHAPRLLLLDEPTTGLDPDARRVLWQHLSGLHNDGVTIIYTTHWFEDADHAHRVAIIDSGSLVAWDTPAALKASIHGEMVAIETADPAAFAKILRSQFSVAVEQIGRTLRFAAPDRAMATGLLAQFASDIQSFHIGRPTLQDVYTSHTGKQFVSV